MRLPVLLLVLFGATLPDPARAEFNKANDWVSTAPYDVCPIAPLDWFTPAEAWAWEQICMDRGAYMLAVPEDDKRTDCHIDPKDASPYGNILGSRFMNVVNTQEPFISYIPSHVAYFTCATVQDELSFVGTKIPHTLNMKGFMFHELVSFGDGEVSGGLYMSDSHFFKDLILNFSSLGAFDARNSIFVGKITAEGAKIRDNFILEGSDIQSGAISNDEKDFAVEETAPNLQSTLGTENAIVIDEAAPDNPYLLQDRGRFNDDNPWPVALHLQDASIGGNLQFNDTRMIGRANMLRLEVGSGLYAKDAILGWVDLDQATVSHDVVLSGSIFGFLTARSLSAAYVSLSRARTLKADFLEARLHGSLNATGLNAGVLNAVRAEVTKSVDLSTNRRSNDATSRIQTVIGKFDLSNSRVGIDVQLQGGIFDTVDLKGSRIGGSLVLFQNGKVPLWTGWGKLDLSNSSARLLSARMPDSWLGTGLNYVDGEWCSYHDSRFRETLADPRS